MMTIEQYRIAPAVDFPRNGEGEQLPQLIDDLYVAREALSWLRHNTKGYAPPDSRRGPWPPEPRPQAVGHHRT